ncbi:uncharacterized protein LOC114306265 [Camellia sinensis]|uniref:uncharacterized protein LOC114306265 n=1 Tax=Camellia sinensis TaxID=4442 RepID=UPI0010367D20|nr:uncharacterized protein LOC114306265 [Camellia sinensis]
MILDLPGSDTHSKDLFTAERNIEYPADIEDQPTRICREGGGPGDSRTRRRTTKEHLANLEIAFAYPYRSVTKLLNYKATYKHKLNKWKVRVIDYFRKSPERLLEQQACDNTGVSTSATARSSSGTTSGAPRHDDQEGMTRRKLDLAALSYGTDPVPKAATMTIRPADQRVLVPKQSVQTSKEVPSPTPHSTTHTEELRGSKRKRSKGKDVVEGSDEQTLAEEWLSPLEYKSRPIIVADSVTDSCDLAFHLSKTLLLPLDMVKCNVDSESLIKGSIQMVTALAQRLHVLEQRRLEQVTDFN